LVSEDSQLAVSFFDKYIDEIITEKPDMKEIQKSFVELFGLITNMLIDKASSKITGKSFLLDYSFIFEAKEKSELIKCTKNRFDTITKYLTGATNETKGNIINMIKEYISFHYKEDITLESVGNYVYLSPVYLSRLFKEKTGENFSDYILKVKMEKAIEFLADSRHKVYDVSNMVGYDNIKYFYKLFKKYYGCTPTEFRAKM
jgi:two-component system response regulator YesN